MLSPEDESYIDQTKIRSTYSLICLNVFKRILNASNILHTVINMRMIQSSHVAIYQVVFIVKAFWNDTSYSEWCTDIWMSQGSGILYPWNMPMRTLWWEQHLSYFDPKTETWTSNVSWKFVNNINSHIFFIIKYRAIHLILKWSLWWKRQGL